MGAEDAQPVIVHPFQVRDGDCGIDSGVQAHRGPEALHIGVVRVAGAVHGVVKGVVDHGAAQITLRGVGHFVQIHSGQFGRGEGSILFVRVLHQNAAQCAAAVGKADHAVFFVHMERARRNKPFLGQLLQLCHGGIQPLGTGHLSVSVAAGQGGHSTVGLLHLPGIGSGQRGLGHGVGCLCGKSRSREERGNKNSQCAERAQKAMRVCFHLGSSSGKILPKKQVSSFHFRRWRGLCQGCGKYFAELSQDEKICGKNFRNLAQKRAVRYTYIT